MTARLALLFGALLLAGFASAAPPHSDAAPKLFTRPATHRATTIDNNQSCDIGTYPAATLLLPFFDVEISKPSSDGANTVFTVVNTSKAPQIVRITIWTDFGYPAAWFNVFLTGYDAQSFSLYDLLAVGRAPKTSAKTVPGPRAISTLSNGQLVGLDACESLGGDLPKEFVADLKSMLTYGVSSTPNACRVGNEHATAVGYVTIDVVNSCSTISPLDPAYYSQVLLFDNVLTGDYERFNGDATLGNYATGNPMVHIKAVPEGGRAGSQVFGNSLPYTFYDRFTPSAARHIDRRQPLPSSFAARFMEGGTGSFSTDYTIWREGADRSNGAGCNVAASTAMSYASIVRFDEMENPTVTSLPKTGNPRLMSFPATSAASTANAPFPPQVSYTVAGWMFLNLDNAAGAVASANSPYSTARPSQNWVTVHLRAEGRYAVEYDATSISNGCTAPTTEAK